MSIEYRYNPFEIPPYDLKQDLRDRLGRDPLVLLWHESEDVVSQFEPVRGVGIVSAASEPHFNYLADAIRPDAVIVQERSLGIALSKERNILRFALGSKMLSSRRSRDRARGLSEIGVDGYFEPPYDVNQIISNFKSVIAESTPKLPAFAYIEDIGFDLLSKVIIKDGQEVDLSNKELRILTQMVANERVMSSDELLAKCWDSNLEFGYPDLDSSLRVTIATLRKKIGKDKIINVPGKGYYLSDVTAKFWE